MTAIGTDYQFSEERPAMSKTKRSFLQKLTERHDALKLHMRSIRGEDLDHDEQCEALRTSSSSSTQKDFFRLSPVAWTTKSERPKNDFAMRYDDIVDDSQPSPIIMQSPSGTPVEFDFGLLDQWNIAQPDRQVIRDFVSNDMISKPRLHSSYSTTSMGSSCTSPRTPSSISPIVVRSRSLPSEMSDEQMDAWLDKPEDAEMHRKRKDSAHSMFSNHSPTMNERVARRRKETTRAMWRSQNAVVIRKNELFSDPFAQSRSVDPKDHEEVFASPVKEKNERAPKRQAHAASTKHSLTFSSLPVEVLLDIARHLDTRSAVSCRSTCKKLYVTIPAAPKPLALKKT
jgi:hypothetical protein